MQYLVKSPSLNRSYGPYESLMEARAQAEKMDSVLRENGLASDAHIITIAPAHVNTSVERGKRGSKGIPSSARRKTSRKKPSRRKRG
jgi:hypothetical protein